MIKAIILFLTFVPLLLYTAFVFVSIPIQLESWSSRSIAGRIVDILTIVAYPPCIFLYCWLIWALTAKPDFLEPKNDWISYVILYIIEIFLLPFLALQDDLSNPSQRKDASRFKIIKRDLSDWGIWWAVTYVLRIIWAIILNKLGAGFTDNIKNEIALWLSLPYWMLFHPFIKLMCILSVVAALIKLLVMLF